MNRIKHKKADTMMATTTVSSLFKGAILIIQFIGILSYI